MKFDPNEISTLAQASGMRSISEIDISFVADKTDLLEFAASVAEILARQMGGGMTAENCAELCRSTFPKPHP